MQKPKRNTTIINAILWGLAVTAIPAPVRAQVGEQFISPSHPHIRYTGRFDRRNPQAVRFDWPGSAIEMRFSGTSCAVRIRGDGGRYNVFVNDSLFVTRFDTLYKIHPLVDNLRDTVHYLKIVKRFEGLKGHVNSIGGFYIDAGKTLHPLDAPPRHRIEFIGGSNLLGFGVEADTVHCGEPGRYSNAYLSFGYAAARELGAECHIVAVSGKGLLRNWQSPYIAAPRTFERYYERALRNDSLLKWDFKSWTPDVTVVNFGINDYSTRPHTPRELFKATYRSFVQNIYARNPRAHVVCMTSSREPLKTYVSELVEEWRSEGNRQIHFYSFTQVPKSMSGCDWHPNREAQGNIGRELAEVIRPLLE